MMCFIVVGFVLFFLSFHSQQKLSPEKIYHVLVAPCFDKKLEAVREEFYNSLLETRDVDCVLTSGTVICAFICVVRIIYTDLFCKLYFILRLWIVKLPHIVSFLLINIFVIYLYFIVPVFLLYFLPDCVFEETFSIVIVALMLLFLDFITICC